MSQFDIYMHPGDPPEAVKRGWSWPAFFFTVIWALVKKMWGVAAVLLLLSVLAGLFDPEPTPLFAPEETVKALPIALVVISYVLHFAISIVAGVKGNEWRIKSLSRRGFKRAQTIEAKSTSKALEQIEQTGLPGSSKKKWLVGVLLVVALFVAVVMFVHQAPRSIYGDFIGSCACISTAPGPTERTERNCGLLTDVNARGVVIRNRSGELVPIDFPTLGWPVGVGLELSLEIDAEWCPGVEFPDS